jgi:hypothetical protein
MRSAVINFYRILSLQKKCSIPILFVISNSGLRGASADIILLGGAGADNRYCALSQSVTFLNSRSQSLLQIPHPLPEAAQFRVVSMQLICTKAVAPIRSIYLPTALNFHHLLKGNQISLCLG